MNTAVGKLDNIPGDEARKESEALLDNIEPYLLEEGVEGELSALEDYQHLTWNHVQDVFVKGELKHLWNNAADYLHASGINSVEEAGERYPHLTRDQINLILSERFRMITLSNEGGAEFREELEEEFRREERLMDLFEEIRLVNVITLMETFGEREEKPVFDMNLPELNALARHILFTEGGDSFVRKCIEDWLQMVVHDDGDLERLFEVDGESLAMTVPEVERLYDQFDLIRIRPELDEFEITESDLERFGHFQKLWVQ